MKKYVRSAIMRDTLATTAVAGTAFSVSHKLFQNMLIPISGQEVDWNVHDMVKDIPRDIALFTVMRGLTMKYNPALERSVHRLANPIAQTGIEAGTLVGFTQGERALQGETPQEMIQHLPNDVMYTLAFLVGLKGVNFAINRIEARRNAEGQNETVITYSSEREALVGAFERMKGAVVSKGKDSVRVTTGENTVVFERQGATELPPSSKPITERQWTNQMEMWRERLPESEFEVLRQQTSMQRMEVASQSKLPLSLYYPESQARNIETLKPRIEQLETEMQAFFLEHFPKMNPMIAQNRPKIVFAEGLGEMGHKTAGDIILLDTVELRTGEAEKVIETILHERTHQMMQFYLVDQLGYVENMSITEGFANFMPEIIRGKSGGLDYQSYAQGMRDVSRVGEDISNGMSLNEAISQRETLDKFGLWNYEYGQAFVKTFIAQNGMKEFFRFYRTMGQNPQKYGDMGAIEAVETAMKEMGNSRESLRSTLNSTEATLKLRGKQNVNLYRELLRKPEEEMLRILEGQDVRVLLSLSHGTTREVIKSRIGRIEKRLRREFPENINLKIFIKTLNDLNTL